MDALAPIPAPTDATRAQWRMALVQAHGTKDWPLALSVLEAMRRAGVAVADTARDATQADYVIADLGRPDGVSGYEAFADGYERASRQFHYEGDSEAERDGADHYRAVYRALDWALGKYNDYLETQYRAAQAAKVVA